ncbi:MAG: hypothetical protein IPL46_17070 [Saprospiraceae bacterium]|nr:hypothetical protein [Saprospiraceae bacterium]
MAKGDTFSRETGDGGRKTEDRRRKSEVGSRTCSGGFILRLFIFGNKAVALQ